jgi:hypothetical protein
MKTQTATIIRPIVRVHSYVITYDSLTLSANQGCTSQLSHERSRLSGSPRADPCPVDRTRLVTDLADGIHHRAHIGIELVLFRVTQIYLHRTFAHIVQRNDRQASVVQFVRDHILW